MRGKYVRLREQTDNRLSVDQASVKTGSHLASFVVSNMRRMGSVPFLSVNVNATIDTMLKLDADAEVDAKYERTLKCCFR